MIYGLYYAEDDYIRFLWTHDSQVMLPHGTHKRPYLLYEDKLGRLSLIPISSGDKGNRTGYLYLRNSSYIVATLQVSKRIPYRAEYSTRIDINSISDRKYANLLILELQEIKKLDMNGLIDLAANDTHELFMIRKSRPRDSSHLIDFDFLFSVHFAFS